MGMPRKQNRYDLSKGYGIGYTSKGQEFYFDLEDFEKVKKYCWSINKLGYLLAKRRDNPKKMIYMHRLIMNEELSNHDRKLQIDHIDLNKQNNRRTNLRLVTLKLTLELTEEAINLANIFLIASSSI